MEITLPRSAEIAIETLASHGYEAYVVGGCVRDALLGRTPHDWDVTTSATPGQVMAAFEKEKVIPTGLAHGTVTVLLAGEMVEVTTFRADGPYSDHRHPDAVRLTTDVAEDLARRDFTINAMAWHPDTGLVDPYGGRQDLAQKLLRCVGDPRARLTEDALRILRCLRFSAQLGFEIEAETEAAIFQLAHLMDHVSRERIAVELEKLLCGDHVLSVLLRYPKVLGIFLPEVLPTVGFAQNNPHHQFDVWVHIAHSVANAPPDPQVRMALLFHDLGKPKCYTVDEQGVGHFYGHAEESAAIARAALRRLRYSSEMVHGTTALVEHHHMDLQPTRKSIRKRLRQVGEETLRKLILVKRADGAGKTGIPLPRPDILDEIEVVLDQIIEEGQCFDRSGLAVTGRDLIELGVPPGPQVGKVLDFLLGEVVEERCANTRKDLLALAQTQMTTEEMK